MKKKPRNVVKPLELNVTTVRQLTPKQLATAAGGGTSVVRSAGCGGVGP